MQRPTLNPLFMDGLKAPPKRKSLLSRLLGVVSLGGRFMAADLLFWRSKRLQEEDGNIFSRMLHRVLHRLAIVPVLALAVVLILVYVGTHPGAMSNGGDPQTQGLYFDTVSFNGADGHALDGWFVPVLDAKQIVEKKDQAIHAKYPAVVLVYDYGQDRSQTLPLVKPLHDAGYAVFVPTLRGTTESRGASTFGLREADDVQATVDMLRRRAGIDPNRIAVIGLGTGANAAILAAGRDTNISALVLDRPVKNPDDVLVQQIGPKQFWLAWMRPVCKLAFEAIYRVDADDLDMQRCAKTLASRPVLMFDGKSTTTEAWRPDGIQQVQAFLAKIMAARAAPAHAAATPASKTGANGSANPVTAVESEK
jgi:pimeloyl-ACP methyl ester carboxylesterase